MKHSQEEYWRPRFHAPPLRPHPDPPPTIQCSWYPHEGQCPYLRQAFICYRSNGECTFTDVQKIENRGDDYFARKKLLYEDASHHNAVFIGTDEGGCMRHAHLRSTNSFGKAFRLNVESSDPRYSFHHTGTDGSLYVFEAPIDMLSYISMNPQQWQEHSYVACCGTSPLPVMQMLQPETQIVYLCLDNDDAGHKASERMAEQLRERGVMTERLVPELKDWNDDLLHAQKEELAPCLSL